MGLEEFTGFDQGEGMDAASFEKFKEKMRKAAAQIKAIKKEENKRKKKEDELIKILLKFIKTSHKQDLVLLISRTLEKNIPANFILAVILLGNEDIQREIGKYLMLEGGGDTSDSAGDQEAREKNLVFFSEDETLPLKVKIEIDRWIKNLLYQAGEHPQRLLRTAYDVIEVDDDDDNDGYQFSNEDKKIKKEKVVSKPLMFLTAHVILDFLKQNKIDEDITKLKEFSEFLLNGILNKIQEDLGNRKELGGGEDIA